MASGLLFETYVTSLSPSRLRSLSAINKFEIAGYQSQRYTVLVVSDLPRAESLRIARNAALGLT